MRKKDNNLLVDAYCDLIEAKLPITGKSQRRYLNELRRVAINYMRDNDYRPGLEDLYNTYGAPEDVAKKLAAVMSDPEHTDFDVSRIICDNKMSNNTDNMHIMGCKRLTMEQAQELMQRLSNGEKLTAADFDKYEDADISDIGKEISKHCKNHNNDNDSDIEDALTDMAAAFEEANELADNGADVAEIALHTGIPTTALYLGGFGNPEDDMADFIIPVRFQMQGYVKVRATSIDDAIMTADTFIDKIPVPEKATMVPDTMTICHDETMVSLFTDKFRRNVLKLEPTDTDIVSPLIDRDEMLDKADPNLIMDTIMSIMGIETDADYRCDNSSDNNHYDYEDDCTWIPTDEADDDDADATVKITCECDGKCQYCSILDAFGSCPIIEKCANHSDDEQVMLHITVPCYGKCDTCPITEFLGECPVTDSDEDDPDDNDTNNPEEVEMDIDEYDDCFWDEIDELVCNEE